MFEGIAQQEPQFSGYWNNYSSYNPAATGLLNDHYFSLNNRIQWAGFSGAPNTINALYDVKISSLNSGVGVGYTFEEIGSTQSNKVNLNYSYHIDLGDDKVIGIGLAGTYNRLVFQEVSSTYEVYGNGSVVQTGGSPENFTNMNAGIMFKTPKLLLGASVTQLLESTGSAFYSPAKHAFVTASYAINVSETFILSPKLLAKSDFRSAQFDFNLVATYNKMYWLGIGYRASDAIIFSGGIEIMERFRIGYIYDRTTSLLRNYSNGSHEIITAIMFDR
jgi:type IX secretion system PorP/SprF family membrane protein